MSTAWQPIETAPRTGERVLCGWAASCVFEGSFSVEHGVWRCQQGAFVTEPTHWMPLPSPPEAKEVGSMIVITMTEFRAEPGERIIDVIRDRKSFLLTKAGKPVAKLVPVDDSTIIERDGTIRGPLPLTFRTPLGG